MFQATFFVRKNGFEIFERFVSKAGESVEAIGLIHTN